MVTLARVHVVFFFFFQAEDGIRDLTVTGVQTCALPICFSAKDAWTRGLSSSPTRLTAQAASSPRLTGTKRRPYTSPVRPPRSNRKWAGFISLRTATWPKACGRRSPNFLASKSITGFSTGRNTRGGMNDGASERAAGENRSTAAGGERHLPRGAQGGDRVAGRKEF